VNTWENWEEERQELIEASEDCAIQLRAAEKEIRSLKAELAAKKREADLLKSSNDAHTAWWERYVEEAREDPVKAFEEYENAERLGKATVRSNPRRRTPRRRSRKKTSD